MADDPNAEPTIEPVVAAEPVVAVEPVVEPVVELTPEPAPKLAPQMVPVTVVAELRGKARNLEGQLQEANRRAADAEALAARLAKGEKAAADPPARATVSLPADEVREAARRLNFEEEVAAVQSAGFAQFGRAGFTDTINALAAYGADSDGFVAEALAVAKGNAIPPHVFLRDLAQNGEKTVALVGMTPTQRIAELTRIAMAAATPKVEPKPEPKVEAKPAAAAISKAPAPKPAMAPVASAPEVDPRTPEGNEKMTDAEWESWYKSKYIKRTA